MKFLLLFAVGMAVAQDRTTPSPDSECRPSHHDNYSLLSSLLQATGYSDVCVAGALDSCSSAHEDGQFQSLLEEARGMVQQVSLAVNKWESRPRHCKDLLTSGDSGKGLRQVYPYPGQPHHRVTVYCDHTVDGGGWTVFQRRTSDSIRETFTRSFLEYKLGFGDMQAEFWLGLDLLHELTSTTLQQLRVDLEDYEGGKRFAKYGLFHVGAPETNYTLTIGRYSGDAGDSMAWHNGMQFTTHDADNDKHLTGNCAAARRGGWWFNACETSNLNGYQHVGHYAASFDEGINWDGFRGGKYSLRRTSMMIRPAF